MIVKEFVVIAAIVVAVQFQTFDFDNLIKESYDLMEYTAAKDTYTATELKDMSLSTTAHQNKWITPLHSGPYFYFAINNDNELIGWGNNDLGALGTTNFWVPYFEAEKIMDNIVFVSSDQWMSLAVDQEGGLWTWNRSNTPYKIMDNVSMASAGDTILVVKKDDSLWGWGAYSNGQLADGRFNEYRFRIPYNDIDENIPYMPWDELYDNVPKKIMDDVKYALSITSTGSIFALKTDGSLWAWGGNRSGALGDGTTISRIHPVKIMDDVVRIERSTLDIYAIKQDRSLWTWGGNSRKAEKCDTGSLLPYKIMDDVVYVSAHNTQPSAVKSDGSLWFWGLERKYFGGSREYVCEPYKVMDDVVYTASDGFSTIALKRDGSVWIIGAGYTRYAGGMVVNENFPEPTKIMDNIRMPSPDILDAYIFSY